MDNGVNITHILFLFYIQCRPHNTSSVIIYTPEDCNETMWVNIDNKTPPFSHGNDIRSKETLYVQSLFYPLYCENL